ncbi:MAG: hypothetical protein QNJ34_23475 [Xenococcaceae cyanobacterium MO_188.B29]|nr:hypothetical protein [Xenococcaceae cyanobacterium MO_188.B29]
MKIKHIISGISPLAFVLGWNCITINSVDAATLNFTYTLESTETISGSFDGDIAADGNEVENLRNFTAVYSGNPSITFDTLQVGDFFTIDLSEFQLYGTSSSLPGAKFLAVRGDNGVEDISVFVPATANSQLINDSDTVIVNDRLSVTTVDIETTSEPGITLVLTLLGGFAGWQKLNKKQVSS